MVKGLKAANKLKILFHNASSAYASVHDKINNDKKWSWAKDGPHFKKLCEAKTLLAEEMSEWQKNFVVEEDMNKVKKADDTLKVISELENFSKLKGRIETLVAVTKALLRAQHEFDKL